MDINGEYIHGRTWKGTMELDDPVVARSFTQNPLTIVVEVRVFPNRRGRPAAFTTEARLRNYNFVEKVWNGDGKCRSIKDAVEKVLKIDFRSAVRRLLRDFFSPVHASCIWGYDRRGELIPICTSFDPFGQLEELPSGKYLGVSLDCGWNTRQAKLVFTKYEKGGLGRSSGGVIDLDKKDRDLYWLLGGAKDTFLDRYRRYCDECLIRVVEEKFEGDSPVNPF
jgi:hypothetical protein